MHSLSVVLALTTVVTGAIADLFSTGPSYIRIVGRTNMSINGYTEACSSGSGEQGLCYVDRLPDDKVFSQFYFNYTVSAGGVRAGMITFNMNVNGTEPMSSAVRLVENPGSNVNLISLPVILDKPLTFSAVDDGHLYLSGIRDDTHWNETRPDFEGNLNMANFFLCWQWVGIYWYYSLAWATSLSPQNPSCEAVDLLLTV
ncbi:hypothetical protein F5Y12DRAFT_533624 [Xylaria sp. FL1777]|nr:hypothetical protein F5Y12DRAFT_533624 [Xylaria sp. FL1777]